MNEKILGKEKEIKDRELAYQAELAKLTAAVEAATAKRDRDLAKLMQERDALALEHKLADFPADLIREHVACSVCGGLMRPFVISNSGKKSRFWACQAGNLEAVHDLIPVA